MEHILQESYVLNSSQRAQAWNTLLGPKRKYPTMHSITVKPLEGMAEGEYIVVNCGGLSGKLHMNRFLCPGIRQECIEVQGATNLVTPKQFCVMGDKQRLKDWKNAIRSNGFSIRRLMEYGNLTFYNHKETCTGKCISRHPGVSKYDITKFNETDPGVPTFVPYLKDATSKSRHKDSIVHSSQVPLLSSSGSSPISVIGNRVTGTATVFSLDPNSTANALPENNIYIKREEDSSSDTDMSSSEDSEGMVDESVRWNSIQVGVASKVKPDVVMEESITDLNLEDNLRDIQTFWKGIHGLGLLDEFFREIAASLLQLKVDLVQSQMSEEDVTKLGKVVSTLEINDKLKWKLAAHKSDTERQKERIQREMEALKKRVACAAQKQQELKRKSKCFDELIDLSRPKRVCPSTVVSPEVTNKDTEETGDQLESTAVENNVIKVEVGNSPIKSEGLTQLTEEKPISTNPTSPSTSVTSMS